MDLGSIVLIPGTAPTVLFIVDMLALLLQVIFVSAKTFTSKFVGCVNNVFFKTFVADIICFI